MKFTPADHLGAVDRDLSTVTRDGHELRQLAVSRTYDAAPDEVWDALTTPDRISRWLGPVSGDLELGDGSRLRETRPGRSSPASARSGWA